MPTQSTGPAALDEQLKHASEATDYLLTSVIQAKKKENGKFGQKRKKMDKPKEAKEGGVDDKEATSSAQRRDDCCYLHSFPLLVVSFVFPVMNIQPRHTVPDAEPPKSS